MQLTKISDNVFQYKELLSKNEVQSILDYINILEKSHIKNQNIDAISYNNPEGKWATDCLMNIDKRIMSIFQWKSCYTSNWIFFEFNRGQKYLPHYNNSSVGTLLISLQNASVGGVSCFPELKLQTKMNIGDALFYRDTLYGETRVINGSKILMYRDFYKIP